MMPSRPKRKRKYLRLCWPGDRSFDDLAGLGWAAAVRLASAGDLGRNTGGV